MSSKGDMGGESGALVRSRAMSQALVEAARRARFSSRSRRALVAGGFDARRGQKAIRIYAWVSLFALFLAPSVCAAAYFGYFASDIYVSTAQFTVMGADISASGSSSGSSSKSDPIGAATGIPALAIIQDTQILVDYLKSRAAVELLEKSVGLREIYSRADIDLVWRFKAEKPIEKFVDYWGWMSRASIGLPSGEVTLEVRAFSPQDARRIADEVLAMGERLINGLNARLNADQVAGAEQYLRRSASRLAASRAALETARNQSGVISAKEAAAAVNKLIADLRSQQSKMRQEYDADLRTVSAAAPQMLNLKARIDSSQSQISDLQKQLTAVGGAADEPLSHSISQFNALELERQIAERLYTDATASLEVARLTAEHKMMYLNVFVPPLTPEDPKYPYRALGAAIVAVAGLLLWSLALALVNLVRNYMA